MIAWLIKRRGRIIIAVIVIVIMYLTDIGPRWGPRSGEVAEAMKLARSLKELAPAALDEIHKEHVISNELKITLEEGANLSQEDFRAKFNSIVDRLVEMRNKRQEILDALKDGTWDSPMVTVVQFGALAQMKDEIVRTNSWIEFATNIRLRSDLGRKGDFPEATRLRKQLEGYLSLPPENPLNDQVRYLREEFRFVEAELFPKK